MNSVTDIVGLSIGTRPDCVNEPILDMLHDYTKDYLIWIEYGLQSTRDRTLKLIRRGHDFQCFKDTVEMTKNRGIKVCAHVILGLPGENRQHMLETAHSLSEMGIDGIKLHLLYVVKGTKLEDLFKQGGFRCLDQQEYVSLVCDFLERLPENMVIQRLTGDPHPAELVAPAWATNKSETLNMIREMLEKRDSWQGKFVK